MFIGKKIAQGESQMQPQVPLKKEKKKKQIVDFIAHEVLNETTRKKTVKKTIQIDFEINESDARMSLLYAFRRTCAGIAAQLNSTTMINYNQKHLSKKKAHVDHHAYTPLFCLFN